eukprot:309869-Chlamydomonas_euryale.AAC.2
MPRPATGMLEGKAPSVERFAHSASRPARPSQQAFRGHWVLWALSTRPWGGWVVWTLLTMPLDSWVVWTHSLKGPGARTRCQYHCGRGNALTNRLKAQVERIDEKHTRSDRNQRSIASFVSRRAAASSRMPAG